ncbi:MAG: carbohydrate binding family 9 domain-containing protein [Acidobacteria bacterium]|nr:carbohydrate binding family 9 domain-containing protein [Acidobacteriota bacterium]
MRVAFDATALYVAVRAFDTEASQIVGLLTRRDQRSPSDWIRVIVDSYHDRRTAYEFGVNPAGVRHDRYWFNDNSNDDSWDAVWDVEVGRDATGWRAEFRIPFSQLRFSEVGGAPVGFAVVREIGRLAETSTWPLLPRSANGYVSSFADIQGLTLTGTPKKLELSPYSVGRLATAPREDVTPAIEATDPGGSLGVDVKYAVRPNLTLSASANPDFGQVEADPAVVNLDAFESFFAERRPFFVEGSGTFQFNIDCNDGNCTGLFYSRRIGRAPQGEVDTVDGEYVASPDAATIIGAAKLTGRVGRFSVGALSAVTTDETAVIARAVGPTTTQMVEPLTGYTVLRARREFANQSNLGFMATSTNRRLADGVDFLPNSAYTGGVDYDWRVGRNYSVSGFWAGSRLAGSTDAITQLQENNVHAFQRPDAGHLDVDQSASSLGGHGGAASFGKIGGERTRFSAYYGYKSPGFDMNDLGFQRRADERFMSHWLQVRNDTPGQYVRSFRWNLNQYAGWNFDGDRLWSGANVNMHWVFQNNYRIGTGVNYNAAPMRDRVTRGGPAVRGNRNVSTWYYADLDDRRSIFPGYNGYHEVDGLGTSRHNIQPRITWRPNGTVSISTGIRYNINNDDAQWVENVEDTIGTPHYVFGRIRQRTAAMTFRVNYTLTPNLSIQSYAEPFVSTGAYTNLREVTNGRATKYTERYQPYAYEDEPDFNIRSFRTTNVLRWEYKPGSALFIVWQQRREGDGEDGDFRFDRDFGGIFGLPSHNVFLVKFSYWLNM